MSEDVYTNQAIFDAIAAATDHNDDGIFVDVQKFIDTFNSHRDRKLCTSLDVAQTERRIEALEAALREIADHWAPSVNEWAMKFKGIASKALEGK